MTDASGTYVDGTAGGGGHAEKICESITSEGTLVCIDADEDAVQATRERLRRVGNSVKFAQANFGTLAVLLPTLGISRINGVLLDLGVSSYQIDDAAKGFSFRGEGMLDMRFDRRQPVSARDVLNTYAGQDLERIIREYGEEHAARPIARAIIAARPLTTTHDLARVVAKIVRGRFLTKSLARVFQALRMEVNGELANLSRVLTDALQLLVPGGRIVVITYHSLEDRLVKRFLREKSLSRIPSGHRQLPDHDVEPLLRILTPKPIVPDSAEVQRNPRARSAKMRVAQRC